MCFVFLLFFVWLYVIIIVFYCENLKELLDRILFKLLINDKMDKYFSVKDK